MARVHGPLFSLDAAGTLAGRMQFRHDRRGVHVYRAPDPATVNQRPPTTAQAAVRDAYREAADNWRGMADEERQEWTATAAALGGQFTGWNLFLRESLASPPPDPNAPTDYTPGVAALLAGDYVESGWRWLTPGFADFLWPVVPEWNSIAITVRMGDNSAPTPTIDVPENPSLGIPIGSESATGPAGEITSIWWSVYANEAGETPIRIHWLNTASSGYVDWFQVQFFAGGG